MSLPNNLNNGIPLAPLEGIPQALQDPLVLQDSAESEPENEETSDSSDDEEEEDQQQQQVLVVNNHNPRFPFLCMLHPHDPSRMILSETERQWAVAIKAALKEQDPDLATLSDFDICQIALVDQDNIEGALERAHALQVYKEEYGIVDSLGAAQRALAQGMDLFPGFFLCISYSHPLQRYVLAFDVTKFYSMALSGKNHHHNQALKMWMSLGYYLFQALNPDFQAIRQGPILLVECGGFHWKDNINLELMKKFWLEFVSVYPLHLAKIRHFHTSLFFNLLVSMSKPFIPQDARDVFEIGCVSELGRLDRVYLTPTMEAANGRFQARFAESLRIRQENTKSFRL